MANIINHFLTMNLMGFSFEHFYQRWSIIHSMINLIGLIIVLNGGYYQIWLVLTLSWFLLYIQHMVRFLNFPMYLGYANWVTIFRLSIVFTLGYTYQFLGDSTLFIGFLIAIMMDGVDGYLARKFGQTSRSGECLDMETDAFLVLLISWIHYDTGKFSWWILIPGGFRYYYGLTFFWLKHNKQEFPPKKVRATIAVIFFLALLVPFILSIEIGSIIILIASLLLILSFTASIVGGLYWQLKN